VFEQGFDEEEEGDESLIFGAAQARSPGLQELLPAAELQDPPPSKAWGRTTWPNNDWSSPPQPTHASSPGIDPRDTLVHRLNRLISRIGSDSSVDSVGVSALHSIVDKMEYTIAGGSRPPTRDSQSASSPGFDRAWSSRAGGSVKSPATPLRRRQQNKRRNHVTAEIREQRIAQEAREINTQMEAVAKSLKERQEETEVRSRSTCNLS